MRRTRKILRFLRTLQHSSAVRKEFGELTSKNMSSNILVLKVLTILEHLFTILFFLFDHRVFLGQLEVISKEAVGVYYPRSMKMYRLQNIFGALKNLAEIAAIVMEGQFNGELIDMENGMKLIRGRAIEFIRNVLDIFVASYYLHQPAGQARKIGIIGIITSIIQVLQALNLI